MRLLARFIPLVALLALAAAMPATAHADPLRVAVLPFDNASGEAAHAALGVGLQAMLTTDLAEVQAFTLVERQRLVAIQQELALSESAAIDPATAVKVGRLAGATHLLAGAFTVVGASMRLDARLFDAASGEVALTAAIEGEKDGFFELEKELVRRIITATQAKVSAKERAAVARIHTSDFAAFERFAEGVRAFDRGAHDDALRALREAAAMDAEFKLARLTLDDYQGIIAKLQARADLVDAAERKARALAANAKAREQQTIIDKLWAMSKDADAGVRLAALYQLAKIYGDLDSASGRAELRKFEDHWALERMGDQLCQAYFAEAVKVWPKVPIFISADFGFNVPLDAASYAEDEKRWLAEFLGADGRTEVWQRHARLLDDLDRHRGFARRLHLDAAGHARLLERAYTLGLRLDPDALDARGNGAPQNWRRGMASTLGQLYREAGLFDESTRWFAEAGRFAHERWAITSAAEQIARNKATVAFLAGHRQPHVREWLQAADFDLAGIPDWSRDEVVKALSQSPPTPRGLAALLSGRELRQSGDWRYVLIGEQPVFPIADAIFVTGARSDARRAASFSYYRPDRASAHENPWLAMVGARRGARLEARFELGWAPEADWWHDSLERSAPDRAAAGFVTGRPEVVFLFGVEDVEVPPTYDEGAGPQRQRLQRGLRGFGLRVAGGEAALVVVNEPEVHESLALARYRLTYEVLAKARIDGGARLPVHVSVDGKRVEATVGGERLSATLKRPADGYPGFAFLQPGHVRVGALKLDWK